MEFLGGGRYGLPPFFFHKKTKKGSNMIKMIIREQPGHNEGSSMSQQGPHKGRACRS